MANCENKKFVWLIENFSSWQSDNLYSAPVVVSDVKWRLRLQPNKDSLGVFVNVFDDDQSLPSGWRRYAKFHLTLANNINDKHSIHRETHSWYDQEFPAWGFADIVSRSKLREKDGGFLVNGELTIVAEIEVIGTLDKESSEPLDDDNDDEESKNLGDDNDEDSKDLDDDNDEESKNLDDDEESKDLHKKTPSVKESVDVNGFQVQPSQVESVRGIFELHPDIASEFRGKNQHLRTTCMNFLLSLMEMLRQPPVELSDEDLEEADIALGYLKNANFKVDWLDLELDQVKEKALVKN